MIAPSAQHREIDFSDGSAKILQEARSISPVDDLVIGGQREANALLGAELAVGTDDGPREDGVHTQDGDLRQVEQWREGLDSEGP